MIAMLIIQRTKSASNSGQQSDIASTTIAIARTTIASERKDFPPPNETLLLSPLMITTSGLSVFFTAIHLLVIFGPHLQLGGLPNPPITKEIRSPICFFPSAQIRLPIRSSVSPHSQQLNTLYITSRHFDIPISETIPMSTCMDVMM